MDKKKHTEGMHLAEEVWVANDNQEGLGTTDGNVESLWVAEKAKMVSRVEAQ